MMMELTHSQKVRMEQQVDPEQPSVAEGCAGRGIGQDAATITFFLQQFNQYIVFYFNHIIILSLLQYLCPINFYNRLYQKIIVGHTLV